MKKKLIYTLCMLLSVMSLSMAASRGKLVIGTNATHPPFTYEEKGKITGHDVELLKKALTNLGYEVEMANMKFDGLIPALQQKKINVIACALSVTEERAKKVLFTDTYYSGGTQLGVLKSNNTIKDWADLKGKKVGVELGTIQAKIAHDNSEKEGYSYTEYDSEEIFVALKTGKVDATISDTAIAGYLFNKSKVVNAKLVGKPLGERGMAYAVNLEDKALADEINAELAKMRKNGFYKKNYNRFMGK
ncbi:MAG: ABC transporter substrate-binding protein [Rickettsiales bacterium]|nr:MAG: ABC transporter substrate-binding protein [Rickettsiales bacterium]